MDKLLTFCCLNALLTLLAVVNALLGVVNAHAGHDFDVMRKYYCDNRTSGFPTGISPPYSWDHATIVVECRDHAGKRSFYNEEHTDNNGIFSMAVESEHKHEAYEAYTISSPTTCNIQTDSNHGPVFLTHNNGRKKDWAFCL